MKFHPLANIFPLLDGTDLAALTADILANGLREPITLHPDGSILDGRNRFVACVDAGVEPRFVTWDGSGTALAYVLSLNLHRRHLDESQRAMVAAKIANLGEGRPGKTTDKTVVSQADAGKLLNVSVGSIQNARQVIDHGVPELVQAVERGEIPVTLAAKVSKAQSKTQRAVVKKVAKGVNEGACSCDAGT